MDELSFFRRFRLTKPSVADILEEIADELGHANRVNNPLMPMNQLLFGLKYYSSNAHQIDVGDFSGCSQTSAGRIIHKVSRAIAGLRPVYVKMPTTNVEQIDTQEKFYRIARFPRVLGVIDCTHVKLQSPGGEDAEIFRNRKNYFSLNVQLVGNANLEVTNVVARWPGSVHDATIFRNSALLGRFENGEFGQGLLLGDSGYAQRQFLMTPLLNPHTRGENLYNESHKRTRNVIERINGIIKRRFPVLAYGTKCNVENMMSIVVATTVLHNKARRMGEDLPPPPEEIDPNMLEYLIEQENVPIMPEVIGNNENYALANNYRRQIIDQFFNNLN